jgi:hypothetical protein
MCQCDLLMSGLFLGGTEYPLDRCELASTISVTLDIVL